MMAEVKRYIQQGLAYLSVQKAYFEAVDLNCSLEASGCLDICHPPCLDICSAHSGNDHILCMEGCAPVCIPACISKCREAVDNRFYSLLSNTDETDPEYIDIGDDIMMFVFEGGLRSPLEG
jgi:hypothetical protein